MTRYLPQKKDSLIIMSSKLVFSTDNKNSVTKKSKGNKKAGFETGEGPIKVRLEKKGRGGKVVTKLWNLPMSEQEAKNLKKELQNHMACGATIKESSIELRGDLVEVVISYLNQKGMKALRAGG